MFTLNEDKSIYATRGDIVFFSVAMDDKGVPQKFKAGDVVHFKVYGKKDTENVVLHKKFPVTAETDAVHIYLERADTKIGEVISKPKDYWYSVTLNDDTNPQTIIGYDEDGAKVFKLFPEGADIPPYEPIKPEDIPIVDDELDMTSHRPVENQAVARAIVRLNAELDETQMEFAEEIADTNARVTDVVADVVVERARIDNFVAGATAGDEELVDIRVGADGVTYTSAGTAVREQIGDIKTGKAIPFNTLSAVKTDAFESANLIVPNDITYGAYIGAEGIVGSSANLAYTGRIDVSDGETIHINHCRFITAFKADGTVDSENGVDNQNNSKYAYIVPSGVVAIVVTWNYNKYPDTIVNRGDLAKEYEEYNPTLKVSSLPLVPVEKLGFVSSKNIFDKARAVDGRYLSLDGVVYTDTSTFGVSDYIAVEEGRKIYFAGMADRMRFVTAYDASKKAIGASGMEFVRSYTVPEGVSYIRLSYYIADKDTLMVNLVSMNEPYEEYQLKIDREYVHEGQTAKELEKVHTILGVDSATAEIDNLGAGESIELTDFPYHLKFGTAYTFFGKFDAFDGMVIGSGRTNYNAGYIEINESNIVIKKYLSGVQVVETHPHGLSIETFIGVAVQYQADQKAKITIHSVGGAVTVTTVADYAPSGVISANTTAPMTGVKLSATSSKIKSPVWMFGDSYFGGNKTRVLGQLLDMGFSGYLAQGYAGQGSASAYDDLMRCLNFGTPKYVVWMLGMNDGDTTYKNTLNSVANVCAEKGITLIAGVTPTVPTVSHEVKKDYVNSLGVRTINAYDAVGTNGSGEWYTGYLAADGVHPTELGAKAIAMRFLIDFSEIIQYE